MSNRGMDRREFLRGAALAGIGLSLPAHLTAPEAAAALEPRIRGRATLGRTGLRIGDIGFGSFRLRDDADLVRHALDRGIDYFDTAETYEDGAAERTLGLGLAGVRDRVVLTSKVVAEADFDRDTLMRRLEGSLRRLGTDYVDIYLNHAVNDVRRLANPEWREFTSRAREQGKIRFSGMSGHGHRLVECLEYAIEHELADVVLASYNFAQEPTFLQRMRNAAKDLAGRFDIIAEMLHLPETLRRAKGRGIGVMTMKTLRGARLNDMRPYESGGATFAQAAFRWVLSQDHVDGLIVTMTNRAEIEEYVRASGWAAVRDGDFDLLARYEGLQGERQCRSACGACADRCPHGVEIPEVLRTRMYAEDYGAPGVGRSEYARLGAGARACLTCTDTPCLGACPHGLTIPELTRRAHELCG